MINAEQEIQEQPKPIAEKPKLGFLGLGWIGRNRMEAIANNGCARVFSLSDTSPETLKEALAVSQNAKTCTANEELLQQDVDGIVIATPSALHAQQSIEALQQGKAVFCQKPLGRTAQEVAAVVETAREQNKLLGLDLSYRHIDGVPQMKEIISSGELGEIFSAELVFHNAYGPDKDWFYDPKLAGGGCLTDLGVHMVDLGLWMLNFPEVKKVHSSLFAGGKPLSNPNTQVEDMATATLTTAGHTNLSLACSWNLHAGQDAIISATFYGTNGGIKFTNLNGSFFQFKVERFYKTASDTLATPAEDWGGNAIVHWAKQLQQSNTFHPSAENFTKVAEVIDRIYGRG